MRPILLTAAAFISGGIATGAALSHAQPTSPPATSAPTNSTPATTLPAASADASREHHGMMAWRHGHERPFGRRDFALIYRQPDRQLAPADVQKIAEGFLLWNGNHTWKVSDVAALPDGPIGFNLVTPEGSVVAKFTMDPHTGRIARAG